MISLEQIRMLCLLGESETVDFKREQYKFIKAANEDKSELLKDIISMANVRKSNSAYILIGIEELPNKEGRIVGVGESELLEDADLHQFVNQKTNKRIPFSVYVVASGIAGKDYVQVIEIAQCNHDRPFYLSKQFGGLRAEAVYMRDGTTTVIATPDQVKEMGRPLAAEPYRSLVELPEGYAIEGDWSAVVVDDATLLDLDDEAVRQARIGFLESHIGKVTEDEVEGWPLDVFLEKAKLAVRGKVTRAAILLLGKEESAVKLSPYVAQITWNVAEDETGYEHFGPPFLLSTTRLYRKIRNFMIKIVPKDSMLPIAVPKYVEKVVLEPLHNCIAHQDYSRQERIIVTEYQDCVEMENAGTFYEGKPEDYIDGNKRPRRYRNRLLAEAMAELHMIDAMGFGIRDVFRTQRARYLPMPDYDLSGDHVKVKVYGNVVDESYSRLLIANSNISIEDVVNLDRVQKHLPISSEAASRLRKLKYAEGRGKQMRISSRIAELTDKRAEYIQMRATDDAHLKGMIIDYLNRYHSATREDINKLLIPKMHEALNHCERLIKIGNLLSSLRVSGVIVNRGSRSKPCWEIV